MIKDCHKKPTAIPDYNKHKGGVDTLDENCEEFSCLRKTNRWPMVINYNIINVATNNAFIVMRDSGKVGKDKFSQATKLSACSTICQQTKVGRRNKGTCQNDGVC